MQETKSYSYELYKTNDEYKIVKLFQKTFKKKFNLIKWNWIFKKNPSGKNKISLVFSKKELVAQCASIKTNFKFGNKKKIFYRIQNFMVHKNYRFRNIATEALKFLTSRIIKNKNFIITFPNNNSIKTFLKNNFKRIFYIYTYEILLKKNYKINKKIVVKNSSHIKFEQDDIKLINDCLKKYSILSLRTKNYLNWRYNINYDDYKISRIFLNNKIIALIVAKFYSKDESICICEIFFKSNVRNNLRFILESAVINFRKNKPKKIKIWSMPHYSFHKNLLSFGFTKTDFKTNVCTHKNLSENKLIKKMYLTMGDSDVY